MTEKTVEAPSNSIGRNISKSTDTTWTTLNYGERLFELGGMIFGPKSQMFKLAVQAACLDVLAFDVSKTPLLLKKITEQGSEIVSMSEHAIPRLLQTGPNKYMGTAELLRVSTYQLAMNSEFYFAGRRNNRGDLIEFVGIPKDNVSDTQVNPEARQWYFDINAKNLHDEALFGWVKGRRSLEEVTHVRRRSLNGIDIIPTAKIASASLSLLGKMQEYQSTNYGNNGVPSVAFTFPDGLTDDQFERLKQGLAKSLKKSKDDGTPIILEGANGVVPKIEPLSATMADSEFVKNNTGAAMDVIRYYRVPPHKVFLMENVKYDNLGAAERIYVDDSLKSYFQDIQDGLNRALLTNEERLKYFFEFDVQAAYAMDPVERNKIARERWISGMTKKNEMRREIGYNTQPGPEGEVYIMSGNFVMIDEKNEVLIRSGGNKDEENSEKEEGKEGKSEQGKPPLRVV